MILFVLKNSEHEQHKAARKRNKQITKRKTSVAKRTAEINTLRKLQAKYGRDV